MKSIRKIIRIDQEKCDGCGLCVPSARGEKKGATASDFLQRA